MKIPLWNHMSIEVEWFLVIIILLIPQLGEFLINNEVCKFRKMYTLNNLKKREALNICVLLLHSSKIFSLIAVWFLAIFATSIVWLLIFISLVFCFSFCIFFTGTGDSQSSRKSGETILNTLTFYPAYLITAHVLH